MKNFWLKRKAEREDVINSVDERWQPPSDDENIWIPIRPTGDGPRLFTVDLGDVTTDKADDFIARLKEMLKNK